MVEADISKLHREGITADDDNNPAPNNVMQHNDFLPTPISLTVGLHGVDPWRQSVKFPVGRANLKMNPIPRI